MLVLFFLVIIAYGFYLWGFKLRVGKNSKYPLNEKI